MALVVSAVTKTWRATCLVFHCIVRQSEYEVQLREINLKANVLQI